jgi:hypothetical protein
MAKKIHPEIFLVTFNSKILFYKYRLVAKSKPSIQ